MYPHRVFAQQGDPPWDAEPRFELGPALQQADALPTELRRILTELRRMLFKALTSLGLPWWSDRLATPLLPSKKSPLLDDLKGAARRIRTLPRLPCSSTLLTPLSSRVCNLELAQTSYPS